MCLKKKETMKYFQIFLIVCVHEINCGKILGIFPTPARSHYILANTLMRALAEKGHDVTLISPFKDQNSTKLKNYRKIHLTGIEKSKILPFNFQSSARGFSFINSVLSKIAKLELAEITISHPKVQKLIKSNSTFDVVIVEQFSDEAPKALATHFKGALIVFSTFSSDPWIASSVGKPQNPAYIPFFTKDYSRFMTFYQRTINTLTYIYDRLLHHFYINPKHQELVKKYLPHSPSLNDIIYNTSIVLLNSHPSINQPVPLVPNMIEIGGFHMSERHMLSVLPPDLEVFLNSSTEEIIYVSLGSVLKSCNLPQEKRKALLRAFSKLKQKVLWKYESEIPEQLENVKIQKWLPQQAILAHPNVKLFVTHGGLLSTIETVYHGVPVLAIPIFGDQKQNAQFISERGFGLYLYYQDLTEENLTERLTQLLTEKK